MQVLMWSVWSGACSVKPFLSQEPQMNAFNEGQYLKFVDLLSVSRRPYCIFQSLFFPPQLRPQMMQFELGAF